MICSVENSSCNAVEEAKRLVRELIQIESRGAGDTENAMRRLGNRYGIPWRTFWTLRYRTPRDVFVGVYQKLQTAHRVECERQIERLRHELEVAHAAGVPVQDIVDQAAALAAELADCVAQHRNKEP